jgi:hypothetical protein
MSSANKPLILPQRIAMGPIDETECWRMFGQIVDALIHIARQGIVGQVGLILCCPLTYVFSFIGTSSSPTSSLVTFTPTSSYLKYSMVPRR